MIQPASFEPLGELSHTHDVSEATQMRRQAASILHLLRLAQCPAPEKQAVQLRGIHSSEDGAVICSTTRLAAHSVNSLGIDEGPQSYALLQPIA